MRAGWQGGDGTSGRGNGAAGAEEGTSGRNVAAERELGRQERAAEERGGRRALEMERGGRGDGRMVPASVVGRWLGGWHRYDSLGVKRKSNRFFHLTMVVVNNYSSTSRVIDLIFSRAP